MKNKSPKSERLSYREKNANNKDWYKKYADRLDDNSLYSSDTSDRISKYNKIKLNYDLFNNILDPEYFNYVCKPFGDNLGKLPAKMDNRDIVSGKIKALLGMEMKRPFSWNVIATNPEATTRKEQEEFGLMKDYVISMIITPIKQQIEQEKIASQSDKPLTEEEIKQIQKDIQHELEARTPEEVKKYMKRKHQDPAEVMCQQLLNYLIQKCDLKRKFNEAFKSGLISAREIVYVGIINNEPEVWNVNPLLFTYDKSPDTIFIEDSEYCTCEYKMSSSNVIKFFGKQLTDKEIDRVYENKYSGKNLDRWFNDDSKGSFLDNDDDGNYVRVLHCVWKSLRKIGFLTYIDQEGERQESIVDESYKINKEHGDLAVSWEWIPEVYETWKILDNIYVSMNPVPGQFKDINDLYRCKLPYYGVVHDNTNSEETSLMDRLKYYQYYYNIVLYRLELLLASDKGKKIAIDIDMIPENLGIDTKQWKYFMESTPYLFVNSIDKSSDLNNSAKVLDLSLASDIDKYIQLAQYLRLEAGRSVGITDTVEGQIGRYEGASTTQQALVQSSNILEPYFEIHNYLKRNILQALVETSKVAYSGSENKKLSFFLDDMSRHLINIDLGLLENSTLGIFVSNSAKTGENKNVIRQLAHASLQAKEMTLSDLLKILNEDNLTVMEELLQISEEKNQKLIEQREQREQQTRVQMQDTEFKREKERHKEEIEKIIIKSEEERKTAQLKSLLVAASFNPDMDQDNDGINDYLQRADKITNMKIKEEKNILDREKFDHKKFTDQKKIEIEEKKMKMNENKSEKKAKKS